MKRTLWTFLLVLGMMLAQCVSASATTELGDFYEALSAGNGIITLENDVTFSGCMEIAGTLTIDLNGYVLTIPDGIRVDSNAHLIIRDSNTTAKHKFTPNGDGLWVRDETSGTKTVTGGVITGGYAKNGGGVYVAKGGKLTMTGGNIVGCSATEVGGGVYLDGLGGAVDQTIFTMTGGSITECNADGSGTGSAGIGGGVHVRNGGSFTMSGGMIKDCKSRGSRAKGGGVYIGTGQFTMNGGSIAGCQANGTPGNSEFARGGGVYNCDGTFTMNGGTIESDCMADDSGGGVYNGDTLYANGGEIAGDVVNGIPEQKTGTITGSGGTTFSGKVTNNKDDDGGKSLIECGIFTGEVINNGGEITGGTFTGTFTNHEGTVSGGDFSQATLSGTIYTVTVENDGNGSASASSATATMGEEVTLTATPNSGYHFKKWEVVSGGVTINDNKFIMPAENVTVKAIFERDAGGSSGGGTTYYTLTFDTNGGGSINAVRRARGKTIDLSAYIPTRDGYDFSGWYADAALTQKITEIRLNGSKTVYAGWTESETKIEKNPFADVNVGDWFYHDVMFGYEKGLMSGIDAAAFAPYTNTTRAQLAAIFYRMEGSPAVEGENSFTDVVPDMAWLYDAVTWAQQNGIMGGCGNNRFAPNEPVTREQLVAIFYRYAQYKGYDTTQGGMAIREFDDYESISDYAMGAMTWAVNSGLVKGGDNLLNPKGAAARAEIAAMLHRFMESRNENQQG